MQVTAFLMEVSQNQFRILWVALLCLLCHDTHTHRRIMHICMYTVCMYVCTHVDVYSRFQWPRGLRRMSAADRLLRLWVRIPLGVLCLL